jgi:hypothetical protein
MEQENNISKEVLIAQLEQALQAEKIVSVKDEVRTLREQYIALSKDEESAQRKAFEAKENKEEDEEFVFIENSLDATWKVLYGKYQEKLESFKKQEAEEQNNNLQAKEALLARLKTLVETNMQNVGESFREFYEIRDAWNGIGQVNKSKFKQLQYDYSHLRELFYYNIGIHHELKNYDFKKNAEQKLDIIAQLKELAQQDSIKKMERGVKDLQAKWDEIGPTTNETWEALKNDYWEVVNIIYERIKIHYKALRETQAKVIEEKNALVAKIQELYAEAQNYKSSKEWANLTEKVNAIHQEWKATGFLGKDKEDAVWEQFKQITDNLRKEKNTFFDTLKKQNQVVVDAKNKLITQAESLKDSKEWKKTSEALVKLQQQWKAAGQAQRKTDQVLWEKFRASCDAFFTAKNEHFGGMDARQEDNLKQKEAIQNQIENASSLEALKEQIMAWQAVGYVPKKQMSSSESQFEKAIQTAAKNLNIDKDALQKLKFEAKVASLKGDEHSGEKLKSEKYFVQTQIEKIQEELHRFEENMAFFGPSKGAQKLKEVVEKRMQEAEAKMQDWKDKLKMLQ